MYYSAINKAHNFRYRQLIALDEKSILSSCFIAFAVIYYTRFFALTAHLDEFICLRDNFLS